MSLIIHNAMIDAQDALTTERAEHLLRALDQVNATTCWLLRQWSADSYGDKTPSELADEMAELAEQSMSAPKNVSQRLRAYAEAFRKNGE